jgi:hypothetical protein
MVMGDELAVAVMPPGAALAVKDNISRPPLLDGASKEMVAIEFPVIATTLVGAFGATAGMTLFDAIDASLVPKLLDAFTVKTYETPLVNPVTSIGDEFPRATMDPGNDVTV